MAGEVSEMPEEGRTSDHQARWVAMWREAVRTSPLAIGLVDLSTTRFVEMSDRAAELLGTTPAQGIRLHYLAVTERPREAEQTFRLVRERMLDGIQGRRRFQRPDGSMVELQLTGWAVRSSFGPDMGVWIAREVSESQHGAVGADVVAPTLWNHTDPGLEGARITLDDHWRVSDIGSNASALLGQAPTDLLAQSILELTHVDDLAVLTLAFARATTDTSAEVRIRLRYHGGSWRPVRAVVMLLGGDGSLPFALIAATERPAGRDSGGGVGDLAEHLRRIAAQIETSGILAPLIETATALRIPETTELSARQWEIASRLLRGERVPAIAAAMYVSQSTVRNHLSAIFEKVGVHSQQELIALWRAARQGAVQRQYRADD